MRRSRLALALSLFFLSAVPSFAANEQAQADALEAAMAQAQASANRPGDDALTCEQLQAEMTSTMNDPAFRANVDAMGTQAQSMQDQANKARSGAVTGMATGMAMGVASAFVPGMGYVQGAAMQAQMAGQMKQAEKAQQSRTDMVGNMTDMMPQMMRGNRLYELAQTQKCAFIQGPPPGTPVQ